jgi:hypothetical protein
MVGGGFRRAKPGRQAGRCGRYDRVLMTDRAALEREMEEIRAQLGWVRDYL